MKPLCSWLACCNRVVPTPWKLDPKKIGCDCFAVTPTKNHIPFWIQLPRCKGVCHRAKMFGKTRGRLRKTTVMEWVSHKRMYCSQPSCVHFSNFRQLFQARHEGEPHRSCQPLTNAAQWNVEIPSFGRIPPSHHPSSAADIPRQLGPQFLRADAGLQATEAMQAAHSISIPRRTSARSSSLDNCGVSIQFWPRFRPFAQTRESNPNTVHTTRPGLRQDGQCHDAT